ncbi:hypothetical protein LshimejAT787_2200130 [Lyophyllum shimeji]|uniref:Uncharacterized protein n=1 Tax=Lyophyllum shimeji TaxID=47721 RepID=A0A9P3Q0G2_LYOSH|nr:hypothetical protein LshimejAT787_2200130 [Lyophyllum shimeji]
MAASRVYSLSPSEARARTLPATYFGYNDSPGDGDTPTKPDAMPTLPQGAVSPPTQLEVHHVTHPALQNLINNPSHSCSPPSTLEKSRDALCPPSTSPSPAPPTPCKENRSKPTSTCRKKFTGMDLVFVARAVNEICPWNAGHGQKMKAWENVVEALVKAGFRHKLSAEVVCQKAEGLVGYRKTPVSQDKHIKAIVSILDSSRDDRILISALLDRMESQYDATKKADEVKKAELQKKHEEDTIARDTLRQASMSTSQGKRRSNEVETDTEGSDDSKSGSSSSTDSLDRRKAKRPRPSVDSSQDQLLQFMQDDFQARRNHETHFTEWMERQEGRHERFVGLFEGLLKVEQEKLALARGH